MNVNKQIIDYYKPILIPERKILRKIYFEFMALGVIVPVIVSIINYYLFPKNITIFISLGIGFFMWIIICIQFIHIDNTHEQEHEKILKSCGAECLVLKKCTIALNNCIFSKEEYINGLKAPHIYVTKYVFKIFASSFILYALALIIVKLISNNTLYLIVVSEMEFYIILSVIISYYYSKRVSACDIHYEYYLNELSKATKITGVEMILLFNFEDDGDKKYISYTHDNKKNIIGTKGIRIYIK